ncbi:threonine-phosphate decarboxylase CobD [Sporosarcina sp. CAU 1771]
MQLPEHGANPLKVYAKMGIEPPTRIIDFSENVNPAGPPKAVLKMWSELAEKMTMYPDPNAEPFLSAVGHFHSVEKEQVVVGNGAAELLSLLAERYRGKKAIVVHPTFSEYETTLVAKDVEIMRVLSKEEDGFKLPVPELLKAMESAAVLYLCTPNNPTGMLPSKEELLQLIQFAEEKGCEIILDEAFIDFVDESLSFIPEIEAYPHVIVVRSMTKMYAIPGLRLGYVVANPHVISGIKALASHWNVNGIAAHIGAVCLNEENYRESAIAQSVSERVKLTAFLKEKNCVVTDSVVNFISFKLDEGRDSKKLYRDLLARGIVLRHSENFRGMDGRWFRVGMKNRDMMDELEKELSKWFEEN